MSRADPCDLLVVCYDVASDRRRVRIARVLESYGVRVQESVFECWLTPAQARTLHAQLAALVDARGDRIACYTLRPSDCSAFSSLGRGTGLSTDFLCATF